MIRNEGSVSPEFTLRAYPERSNEMMQEETNFYKLGEPDISGDSLIEINDTKSKKFK